MAAIKVNISDIPSDILGDVQALVSPPKKQYIAIGSSVYQIEPAPAIVLMEAMGMFAQLLEDLRKKKVEVLQSQDPEIQAKQVEVYIRDIIHNSDAGPSLGAILDKLLQGAEKADLDTMNIGQMMAAIDKAIAVNMDTLPASFRDTFRTAAPAPAPEENPEIGDQTKNH